MKSSYQNEKRTTSGGALFYNFIIFGTSSGAARGVAAGAGAGMGRSILRGRCRPDKAEAEGKVAVVGREEAAISRPHALGAGAPGATTKNPVRAFIGA